jgi:hypothetical protein
MRGLACDLDQSRSYAFGLGVDAVGGYRQAKEKFKNSAIPVDSCSMSKSPACKKLIIQQFNNLPRANMSFEVVSERLKALQESNAQLKDLIDRLANLKFQPGSIPLDEEEDNVKVELTSEIHQIIKDQEEDLTILQEDVIDLDFGRSDGELQQQKAFLDHAVKKAIEELKR